MEADEEQGDSMVSIVVADDHKIVREGLIRLLEVREDFTVIGEASNGEEAVPRLRDPASP